jgi:germination protein M
VKKTGFGLVAVAAVALAAGAFLYKGGQPTASPSAPTPEEFRNSVPPKVERLAPSRTPDGASGTITVQIYEKVETDDGTRLKPVKVTLPDTKQIMAAALDRMADLKDSPLPPGTRVRSISTIGDGVVYVDFNAAFKDNFPHGDTNEAVTINAVLATLAQFPGVDRVQIMIEGKKIPELGGTQDLSAPLPVRDAVATARDGSQ